MIIRRQVLNMPIKMWNKLEEIFGENVQSFEITPNEFLHMIGLPGALSVYANPNELEFFKQIYVIAYKIMMNEKGDKTMSDEIKSTEEPVIFDKSMARRCLSYFYGCKNFDENNSNPNKQCMSYAWGVLPIKCGEFEQGKKPVQINTSPNIISIGTKNKELKNKMAKKSNKNPKVSEPVVEETPVEQTQEPVVEETKPEETPVKETKSKKEKAPKTEKVPKPEKTPKGEGAVAKIETLILKMVGEAGKMTVEDVKKACPSEFNAATWQVRIYHLRKAEKLSYNKETKEVSVI